MSKDVTMFNFDGSDVRVIEDAKGEPWFLAKDICVILGLANSRQACSDLDDDEKGVISMDTLGGKQNMTIINESGMYSLVMTSRKPEAKKFKKWVTSEVLPSIRKTGSYSMQQPKPLSQLEILSQSIAVLTEHDQRIKATEVKVIDTQENVKRVEAKVAQISVDLRNGVPHGFISRKNAKKIYTKGLSQSIFEEAMEALQVPTQKYVSLGEGYSTPTFAYQESHIPTAIAHFLRDLEQVSPCQCFSHVLNKRVNYIKVLNYGLKELKAKEDTAAA